MILFPKNIKEFTTEIGEEKSFDLYNKIYEKVKGLDNRTRNLILYIIIVVFLYVISSKTSFYDLKIGPVSINDNSIITKLFPLLFSYLMFELVTTSIHRSEANKTLEAIFICLYKQEKNEQKNLDVLKRISLPYSTWNEVFRVKVFGRLGCLFYGLLILVPILSIFILAVYFEIILLKDVFIKYYDDTFGKLSFYISIWLTIISIWYFLSLVKENVKEQNEVKTATNNNFTQ